MGLIRSWVLLLTVRVVLFLLIRVISGIKIMGNVTVESKEVRGRILQMLANGMKATDITDVVDVTASRISQLQAEPEFKRELEELRFAKTKNNINRDEQMDRIEDKLLDQLERTVSLIVDPMKLTRILKDVNSCKRRAGGNLNSQAAPTTIIQLNVGQSILNRYTVNANSEVVAVDGRTMLTMPSSQFRRFANESPGQICESEPSAAEASESNFLPASKG